GVSIRPDFRFYNGYQKVNLVKRAGILPVHFSLANNYPGDVMVDIREIQIIDRAGKSINQVPLDKVVEKSKFSYKKSTITTILGGPIGIPSWIRTAKANKKIDSKMSGDAFLTADIPQGEKSDWYCFFDVNKSTHNLSDWRLRINFNVDGKKYIGRVKFIGSYELFAEGLDCVEKVDLPEQRPHSVKKKLMELKELLNENLITREEYNSKREEIIDRL
ncbi:MAG: SHOCT domain-containing protein, partial [Desulfobia sp.]